MNTTTKPIPLFVSTEEVPTFDWLRGLMTCTDCQYASSFNLDTYPIIISDINGQHLRHECSSARRISYVQSAAVAALVAMRRARADDELSRPLELPDLKAMVMCHDRRYFETPYKQCQTDAPMVMEEAGTASEEPKAEPTLALQWSKARRRIRAAAKAYSEQTHADY